jgi:MerR family regulatory protein
MTEQVTIGQLAAAAGVNIETIRYYQRRKLLALPDRPSGRSTTSRRSCRSTTASIAPRHARSANTSWRT